MHDDRDSQARINSFCALFFLLKISHKFHNINSQKTLFSQKIIQLSTTEDLKW